MYIYVCVCVYLYLTQLNIKWTIQLKMGRGPEHTLLPELHSSSQKRSEKMHNLTSY